MKTLRLYLLLVVLCGGAAREAAAQGAGEPWTLPAGLPALPASGPALCPGDYLTPAQGQMMLDLTLEHCKTRADWNARATMLRRAILKGAGLDPLPRREPLNPIIRNRRVCDGYSVENVAFESLPGFYATGTLYRPLNSKSRCPAVLATHGHWPITPPDKAPRFLEEAMTLRCAALARMGAVVFAIDMFGFGETQNQVDPAAHKTTLAMPMQLWDNMRALDFLTSIPDVDPNRLAVSGESGGGTQTFLLTAVDPRVAVSVPVVMVSSFFFGGCPCESGRPVHRDAGHFTTNAEIAALAAPRPMLVISDGADWTRLVPQQEFPFLKKIYELTGEPDNVQNVHLATEKHDYGPSKRAAMYAFMAKHLGLNLSAIQDAQGKIDEKAHYTKMTAAEMKVFDEAHPLPASALKGAAAVEAELKKMQER